MDPTSSESLLFGLYLSQHCENDRQQYDLNGNLIGSNITSTTNAEPIDDEEFIFRNEDEENFWSTDSLLEFGGEVVKKFEPFGNFINHFVVGGLIGFEFKEAYDEEAKKENFDTNSFLNTCNKIASEWDIALTARYAANYYGYGSLVLPVFCANMGLDFLAHNEKTIDRQFSAIETQYQHAGFYNNTNLQKLSFWERNSVESAKARLLMAEGQYKALTNIGSAFSMK